MTLGHLSLLLGVGIAVPQICGLVNPAVFKSVARKFPRSEICGYLLMGATTLLFLWNLKNESLADFEVYKKYMYIGFAALGLATCVFLRDFLAVRGLALMVMLLAKIVVDTARWAQSSWRLVLVVLAYLWVVAAFWLTISPWRLRDLIHWSTESEQRIRAGCGVRLAFAVLLVYLGLAEF